MIGRFPRAQCHGLRHSSGPGRRAGGTSRRTARTRLFEAVKPTNVFRCEWPDKFRVDFQPEFTSTPGIKQAQGGERGKAGGRRPPRAELGSPGRPDWGRTGRGHAPSKNWRRGRHGGRVFVFSASGATATPRHGAIVGGFFSGGSAGGSTGRNSSARPRPQGSCRADIQVFLRGPQGGARASMPEGRGFPHAHMLVQQPGAGLSAP